MKIITSSKNRNKKGKSIILLIVVLLITAASFYGGYYYKSWVIQKKKKDAEEKRAQASVNAEIYITSNIKETTIILDGKDTGKTTPASINDLKPGVHTITLTHADTYPWKAEVELKEREFITVQAEMNEKD